MNSLDYVKLKIKDLKKRKPKLMDELSKYAMQMSINELEDVKSFMEGNIQK